MRAVWSFWSRPHRTGRNFGWRTELHHRLSWILSLESARPHFASTTLHTDDAGAALLVEGLGLRFDYVSTSLNALEQDDPDWWTLGKLYTYAQQEEPFLHIDSDAYLFRALPEHALCSPILAQHPEGTAHAMPWYDVEGCEIAIRTRGDGIIPASWEWYRTFSPVQDAACCGILGGHATDLLRRYAENTLGILRSPGNVHAFDAWPDKRVLNPFFEQYLLAAAAAHQGTPITYLFESHAHAASGAAARIGFAHLMAGAKSDEELTSRLQSRVARDYPVLYRRAVDSLDELAKTAVGNAESV